MLCCAHSWGAWPCPPSTDRPTHPAHLPPPPWVPLKPYLGRRLILVLRVSTNVNFLAFGLDNVMIVQCKNREDVQKKFEAQLAARPAANATAVGAEAALEARDDALDARDVMAQLRKVGGAGRGCGTH